MNAPQFLIERAKPGPGGRPVKAVHTGTRASVPRGWRVIRQVSR